MRAESRCPLFAGPGAAVSFLRSQQRSCGAQRGTVPGNLAVARCCQPRLSCSAPSRCLRSHLLSFSIRSRAIHSMPFTYWRVVSRPFALPLSHVHSAPLLRHRKLLCALIALSLPLCDSALCRRAGCCPGTSGRSARRCRSSAPRAEAKCSTNRQHLAQHRIMER